MQALTASAQMQFWKTLRFLRGVPGGPVEGQGKGQEDQGEIKELWGTPLIVLRAPGPPGLAPGLPLDPLEPPPLSLS